MSAILDPQLYESDFFEWTRHQAEALRREAAARSNAPVDWLNLAEEIESLGKSDRRALESRLQRVIEHLLKLQFAPLDEPRRGWTVSVVNQRRDLAKLLRDSPSLKSEAAAVIEACHRDALEDVQRLAEETSNLRWPDLPAVCPYPLEQLLDRDFWPERAMEREQPVGRSDGPR